MMSDPLQWWMDTCGYWHKQAEERDNRIAVQVASSKDLEKQIAALRAELHAKNEQLAALRRFGKS